MNSHQRRKERRKFERMYAAEKKAFKLVHDEVLRLSAVIKSRKAQI